MEFAKITTCTKMKQKASRTKYTFVYFIGVTNGISANINNKPFKSMLFISSCIKTQWCLSLRWINFIFSMDK